MTAGMVETVRITPSAEPGDCKAGSHRRRALVRGRSGAGAFESSSARETPWELGKMRLTTCLMARIKAPLVRAQRTPKTMPRNIRPRYGRTKDQSLRRKAIITVYDYKKMVTKGHNRNVKRET